MFMIIFEVSFSRDDATVVPMIVSLKSAAIGC